MLRRFVCNSQLLRKELIEILSVLQSFYDANELIFNLPFRIFYIKPISEQIDIKTEFMLWTKCLKNSNRTECSLAAPGPTMNKSLIEFPFCLEPEK